MFNMLLQKSAKTTKVVTWERLFRWVNIEIQVPQFESFFVCIGALILREHVVKAAFYVSWITRLQCEKELTDY